jgi:hypothetical protein
MGAEFSAELRTSNERKVGARIAVRRINSSGTLVDGQQNELTAAIMEQMRIARCNFSKSYPKFKITKIEYIMNSKLYNGFDATRKKLRKLGRNAKEIVLFHGTPPGNIQRLVYPITQLRLELSKKDFALAV